MEVWYSSQFDPALVAVAARILTESIVNHAFVSFLYVE